MFRMFSSRAKKSLLSSDAQTILAEQLAAVTIQLNDRALSEAAFLILYCGEFGADLVSFAMQHKVHQAPFAGNGLSKSLQAIALKEFMKGVNINLGGK